MDELYVYLRFSFFFDLENVKQLIEQQELKYRLKNCDAPLFQCPNLDFSGAGPWKSDLFLIGYNVYVAQLVLRREVLREGERNFTLRLERLIEYRSETDKTFPLFQHFVCKVTCYDNLPTFIEYALSKNLFDPDARVNEIHFQLKNCMIKKAKLEIYLEHSTTSDYVSPFKNAVVGKIENFSEMQRLVSESRMLVVSPRFVFGSADRQMVARFWRTSEIEDYQRHLVVSLHVINRKDERIGLTTSLKLCLTIFNQRDKRNDLVKKVVLLKEENKCEYPIFLDLEMDLIKLGCLENDTIYYKLIVEPFNYKLSDETVKNEN